MKSNTLLWIGAAIGIGVLIKKNNEKTAAKEALVAATPPAARIAQLSEPTGSAVAEPEIITGPEPTEIYERTGRGNVSSWNPSWGSLNNRNGRGRSR
jgi:hypothetical protein